MAHKQSKVDCRLCHKEYSLSGLTRHLKSCLNAQNTGAEEPPETLYTIKVADKYDGRYWLYIEVPSIETFGLLDRFFRRLWLECCGHLSDFRFPEEIRRKRMEGHLHPRWTHEDEEIDEEQLSSRIELGTKFEYDYDYGSTTTLTLKVVHVREDSPVRTPLAILARNAPPEILCAACEKQTASLWCVECSWEDKGELCADCGKVHDCEDYGLEVIANSPRFGVCGEIEDQDEEEVLASLEAFALSQERGPLLSPELQAKSEKVLELLQEKNDEQLIIDGLLKAWLLWEDFVDQYEPGPLSPEDYAAALDYIVRYDAPLLEKWTEAEAAAHYGSSVKDTSLAIELLCEAMDIELSPELLEETYDLTDALGELTPQMRIQQLKAFFRENAPELLRDDDWNDEDDDDASIVSPYIEAKLALFPVGEEEIWECGRIPLPSMPQGRSRDIFLWVRQEDGVVITQTFDLFEGPKADVKTFFHLLTVAAKKRDYLPRKLIVDEADTAEAFREQLDFYDIEVSHGPRSAIDRVGQLAEERAKEIESLHSSGSFDPIVGTYAPYQLQVPGLSAEELDRFFSSCAEFRDESPSIDFADGLLFHLDLQRQGLGERYVSLTRHRGTTEGLTIFHSLDDYDRWRTTHTQPQEASDLPQAPLPLIALRFRPLWEMTLAQYEEALECAVPMPMDAAYTRLLKHNADGEYIAPKIADIRLVTACIEAIFDYMRKAGHHVQRVVEMVAQGKIEKKVKPKKMNFSYPGLLKPASIVVAFPARPLS